jgi:hypothetical protein
MKPLLKLASICSAALGTAAGSSVGKKSTWPLVICVVLLAANSFAAPITLTDSAAGSSSIGGLLFTDAPFGYSVGRGSASNSIVGVGSSHFITGTVTTDYFEGPTDSALASWDMLSSVGPVTGLWELPQGHPYNGLVSTDGGPLYFERASTSAMFQASVVPEPSILVLAGLGVASLMIARRRR